MAKPLSLLKSWLPHLLSLGLGACGGAVASWLHVPLAWMIGAMVTTISLNLAGAKTASIPGSRPAAILVLGTALGLYFTDRVLLQLLGALPTVLLGGFGSVLLGATLSRLMARMAGIDRKTAFYCSVPGGVVAMSALAHKAGVNVATVAMSQSVRVVVVVLTVPPLVTFSGASGQEMFVAPVIPFDPFGLAALLVMALPAALAMRRFGIGNPWMMGPVLLAMALTASGVYLSSLPRIMIDAAQVVMGVALGSRMQREFLRRSMRLVWASAANVLILSGLLASMAFALHLLSELPFAAVVLGTAAGGLPEMTLTAKVLQLGVPLVLAFHLIRLVICNLFTQPLYDLAERLEKRGAAKGRPGE